METYFNIRYEFDRDEVLRSIDDRLQRSGSDYICVADGVILSNVHSDPDYERVVNGGMFAICDSSYVPLYVKLLYGREHSQMSGSHIFEELIRSGKYRMIFLGASQTILQGLKNTLTTWNEKVNDMLFIELPFCGVDEFDYKGIANTIENDGAELIWVALGAPKQERFMHKLKPHLSHGVMIAVGAAFKFFSGIEAPRAPKWMVDNHLEFVYRLTKEPKKQFARCKHIIITLPQILHKEYRRKRLTNKSK